MKLFNVPLLCCVFSRFTTQLHCLSTLGDKPGGGVNTTRWRLRVLYGNKDVQKMCCLNTYSGYFNFIAVELQ